ncbi:AAA family ATPase [Rhizobium sp. CF142]|uniref:AAA family ATPase n=1 Tax=Rhizobium sp. CF142 TaxID=1144314 RepID=UPI00026EF338|nr:AAA family ATPase [Rhizobium sp. CF142]EJJ26565.1 RecF/RecN/SMC N-terminal domain-containing protein [Rhizobium sp. CF142]
MIKIDTLTISEFRGIRSLTISPKRKNFAICGPNGTGKSGVVDALEFVLTGTISRLTGKGRGDLSVRDHGAHVDCQKSPEKAFVEAAVWIPSLNKTVKARRTVKSPSTLELIPDSREARATFRQLEAHPEIALSRREIIRFVLTEPGQRAKDVQALLKLDQLETIRARLQKIANGADSMAKTAKNNNAIVRADLVRAMDIADATEANVLQAANKRRAVLGLAPLQSLGVDVSLRDGLATAEGSQPSRVNKAAAKSDVEAAIDSVNSRSQGIFPTRIADAKSALELLQADENILNAVLRDDFLKTALELYDGELCPVCDTPKTLEEISAIVNDKRKKLEDVKVLREKAEAAISPIREALEEDRALTRTVYSYAKQFLDVDELQTIADFGTALRDASDVLKSFLPLDKTITAISKLPSADGFLSVGKKIEAAINALPEPSDQDAARDYLLTAQLRLDELRKAHATARTAEDRATKARKVFEVYKETSNTALEKVYEDVQANFADLYRRINADDENAFEAKLTPSFGKLGFGVDFYGRGFFPPGAYHSEGHQDSMGLCLYLALMRHLLGPGFTFAVLDDVLMSVDVGHRREVSKLLQAEFPDTQFVLTTHDKAWLKFMSTTDLVKKDGTIHFRKWTVDDGPTVWAKGDVWDEIRHLVDQDDVHGAAALLRRSLEHLSAEFCEALRVKVEFSVDGHYDLGDLLDPAIGQMKSLYRDAHNAATTWQDTDRIAAIDARTRAFDEAVNQSKAEQWQINPSVHYNEWAELDKSEFLAVVEAFEKLCTLFKCDACGALIEVKPTRGKREYLQCLCGKVKFSFMKKPKPVSAK